MLFCGGYNSKSWLIDMVTIENYWPAVFWRILWENSFILFSSKKMLFWFLNIWDRMKLTDSVMVVTSLVFVSSNFIIIFVIYISIKPSLQIWWWLSFPTPNMLLMSLFASITPCFIKTHHSCTGIKYFICWLKLGGLSKIVWDEL